MSSSRPLCLCLYLFLVLGVVAGCASPGATGPTPESVEATESMQELREQLGRVAVLVQGTQASLASLGSRGDLRGGFQEFSGSLEDLEDERELVERRAESMRERAIEYLAAWEREVEQTSNAELRSSAEERRSVVRGSYREVMADWASLRTEWDPYLVQLQDIHTALHNDLTCLGVESARPAIAGADEMANRVLVRLNSVTDRIRRISAGLVAE